ncbi:hypothetical protein C8R47DRAFT_794565 [Mycena vitilis]|nr:hypothetical protein C8R47DRAFT_794565 [Mycena vitilis]
MPSVSSCTNSQNGRRRSTVPHTPSPSLHPAMSIYWSRTFLETTLLHTLPVWLRTKPKRSLQIYHIPHRHHGSRSHIQWEVALTQGPASRPTQRRMDCFFEFQRSARPRYSATIPSLAGSRRLTKTHEDCRSLPEQFDYLHTTYRLWRIFLAPSSEASRPHVLYSYQPHALRSLARIPSPHLSYSYCERSEAILLKGHVMRYRARNRDKQDTQGLLWLTDPPGKNALKNV